MAGAREIRRAAADELRPVAGGPALVAAAPGRVNLVGGHTDYNEGFVLPAAVDRRVAVAAAPRDDAQVSVRSREFDAEARFPLPTDDGPLDRADDWTDYVRGVVVELAADDGTEPLVGADLAVAGDVPPGAGLASSAALAVATAWALLGLVDGAPGPGDIAERRRVASLCHRAESGFVGVDCGVMDQFAAALGERDAALLLDCRSHEHESVALDPGVALLVVDSGVEHDLVDSAYNERRRTCAEGVELLSEATGEDLDALRDVSVSTFERHADALPSRIRARCEHVVRENERVREAARALRSGDHERVGALMRASHASLRDRYEVSCEELDRLVALLDREGVFGARMTGAGFGGSVLALVDADSVGRVRSSVTDAYERETGIDTRTYVCTAVDGVRVRTPT